jgi:hypothetical protein
MPKVACKVQTLRNPKNMKERIRGLVMVAVIVCAAGCSEKVKVTGKVTFPDGSPLTVGKVTFETATFAATGILKEDGTYVLGSVSERDGIPPGLYRVYVAGAIRQVGIQQMNVQTASVSGGQEIISRAMPTFAPAVAPKFTKAGTSGITCDVKKSLTFDFTVEPPQ